MFGLSTNLDGAFGVSYRVLGSFFDRAAIERKVSAGSRRALAKAGAYLRTAARSRLRRRKRASRPGESPSVHSRDPVASLKNILFAYEEQFGRDGLVVGPVRLGGTRSRYRPLSGTVPSVLEFGGQVRSRRRGTITIDARPFMAPALDQVRGELPEFWKNAVLSS